MKKRIIATLLAASMCVSLAACGSSTSGGTATGSNAEEADETVEEAEDNTGDEDAAESEEAGAEDSAAVEAAAEKAHITIGQPPWNAAYYLDNVAQIIMQEGYGYPTEIIDADNPVVLQSICDNEIDVHMNVWRNAYVPYQEMEAEGRLTEVGVLHTDAINGIYVPTYVIEGDAERGIEPVAPDLKTVKDLANYADVFKDPDDPSKGVFYNAPTGMSANPIFEAKFKTYGLMDYFNITVPGGQSQLEASLEAAYEKGEPWVGYSYTPTWVQAKFDMTKLEDEPYDVDLFTEESGYACDFQPEIVVIACSNEFPEKAPDIYECLQKVKIRGYHISDMLWYMKEQDVDGRTAAIYWMQQNPDEWTQWVTEEAAANIQAFLDAQ